MPESTKPFLTTAVALKLQLSAVRRSTLERNGSCATRVRWAVAETSNST